MDYFHYSREDLLKMKISELRKLGTEFGLNSPTSMKKEDLIETILSLTENKTVDEISRGLKKEVQKKKIGRPQGEKQQSGSPRLVFSDSDDGKPEHDNDAYTVMNIPMSGLINEPKPSFIPHSRKETPAPAPRPNPPQSTPTVTEKPTRQAGRKTQEEGETEKIDPENTEIKEGVLEILPDGYGFLRAHNYEAGEGDAYISAQKIKAWGLRKGDWIKAEAQKNNENRPRVFNILTVNNRSFESLSRRKNFDNLTPIYPNERFRLEIPNTMNDFAIRCIDMIAPIGKGQRAMIVSPPKAGKTTFLKKVARSISVNYPDVHLIVLLIDERPEEVTDMKRCIDGEVVFSTFDEMPEHHTKAAEMVLERAKRLVEHGEDVVILMDSLTRLARAYNLTIAPTGRTLSGGIDPGALHSPKRFFGAARNIEFGGSLTIIATALVDTGSRMDDVIYEEFKGTGNMEIHLDRRLSEKRIFPAIDLYKSSTRMEELLLDQNELQGVWAMRKLLGQGDSSDATENLLNMIVKTKTNREFLEQVNLQVMALQKRGYDIK